MDPLAGSQLEKSPYHYCSGNPISRIDPGGKLDGWIENLETGELTWDEKVNSDDDFALSSFDNCKYSYLGNEFQRAYSSGANQNCYSIHYDAKGNTCQYDYPMWIENARRHLGLTEGGNQIIQAMIDQLNIDFPKEDDRTPISSDNDPWCGVFAYSCLTEAGQPVTHETGGWETPALASFFKNNWAERQKLSGPVFGAIAVMKTYSHVAFVLEYDANYVWIIGGNQPLNGAAIRDGKEVNIARHSRTIVDQYLIPQGYNPPPSWQFK